MNNSVNMIDVDILRTELERMLRSDIDYSDRSIAVYGVGKMAQLHRVGRSFEMEGIDPVYFIDNDPSLHLQSFCGKPIINFEEAHELCRNFGVLVCVGKDAAGGILKELKENPIEGASFCMFDEYVFSRHFSEILSVYDMLEDSYSKATYANVIMCRMAKVGREVEYHCPNQYFGIPEFAKRDANEIFVDCGAYVGDTIEKYLWVRDGVFKKIYAFEPEPENYKALCFRVERLRREWAISENRIVLIHGGIGAKSDSLQIVGKTEGGASLEAKFDPASCEDGEKIDVYAIDEYFDEQPVSFIKADIESFEWFLLEGAGKVIRRDRPKLAMCIYHNVSDFYRIALRIRELNSGYRFAVRQHDYDCYAEIVLYAY